MLLETLCIALLLAVGDGVDATSGGEEAAVAEKECPCPGEGACTKGKCTTSTCTKGGCGKASACGAACSKTVAAVEKTCDGCEKTLAAVEKACTACAQVYSVWEKVIAEDEPCCGEGTKCCKAGAKVAANCCDDAAVDESVVPASAVRTLNGSSVDAHELLREKLVQRDELQREIDELSAATESWQQIVVRVKVMEVNLTKMREQGFDFAAAGLAEQLQISTVSAAATRSTYAKAPSGAHPQPPCGAAGTCEKSAGTVWDMLEENNLARVIAEPTLVAVSGRPASFNVGGELPIPAGAGSEGVCQFLSVGTKLDVLASSLGDNKVRLEVRPRISEVSEERAMVADKNGNKIPALRVTECDTACELEFGETAALTGLVQRRIVAIKTEKGVKEKTEDVMLMVVVTPEAVGALRAERVAKRTSTMK